MNPYNVLVKPLLSEKSNLARENANKYSFKVAPKANKTEIRKAVETLFGVKVTGIQTMITRGKIKRRGNQVAQHSSTKKAIVTLAEGTKITVFDAL